MTNSFSFATTLSTPCLNAQVYGLRRHTGEYLAELNKQLLAGNTSKNLPSKQMARIFAALHVTGRHKELEAFLSICKVTDIAMALTLLDRPRLERQLLKKITRIERQCPNLIQPFQSEHDDNSSVTCSDEHNLVSKGESRKRSRKIDQYRSKVRKLQMELSAGEEGCTDTTCAHADTGVLETVQSASVSGALARMIRKWAKSLKPDFLEFIMLEMPSEAWRQVADLIHFHPGDFSVPYFLADVHGSSIPEDSFVYHVRRLYTTESKDAGETFREVAARFPQIYKAYASVRTKENLLCSKEVIDAMAKNMPLDTLVWYFEELAVRSQEVSAILRLRLSTTGATKELLQRDSKVNFFGKLVERILMFQRQGINDVATLLTQVASHLLSALIERFQGTRYGGGKIAVFGDASASMQRAVEAATIMACMVSSCLNGELSFFADQLIESPHKNPVSVDETLAVCRKVRANRSTCLAAALWPYYDRTIVLDAIVLVTDEEENTSCKGFRFADLLKAYMDKVTPNVALIVICVGGGSRYFRNTLVQHGIEAETVTIDEKRPDLTKFDELLEQIAVAAASKKSDSATVLEDSGTTDCEGDSGFVILE